MPSAVVALGGTAFCFGFVIPQIKIVLGRVTPRIQCDSEGTTFRPDPGVDIPMQAAVIGAVVACVLITILLPMGKLAIPVPPNMRYSLPFMAGVLAITGAPMACRNMLRGSMSYLRLTAEGFEIAQGWGHQGAEWALVESVASDSRNQKAPTPSAIVFVMSDKTELTVSAGTYTPAGAALRELVRHYWQHPESRAELTDGRAADRLAGRA